jgi:hypothetical protein
MLSAGTRNWFEKNKLDIRRVNLLLVRVCQEETPEIMSVIVKNKEMLRLWQRHDLGPP